MSISLEVPDIRELAQEEGIKEDELKADVEPSVFHSHTVGGEGHLLVGIGELDLVVEGARLGERTEGKESIRGKKLLARGF
jgi:hypothetical protein